MRRPIKRYAIREIGSGQVLEVGLPPDEAEAYVLAYNRIMAARGQKRAVERVEVAWILATMFSVDSAPCSFRLNRDDERWSPPFP